MELLQTKYGQNDYSSDLTFTALHVTLKCVRPPKVSRVSFCDRDDSRGSTNFFYLFYFVVFGLLLVFFGDMSFVGKGVFLVQGVSGSEMKIVTHTHELQ